MPNFLDSKPAKVLTAFLLLQAVAFYSLARTEPVHNTVPLSTFPAEVGNWKLTQEGVVEQEIQDILKADDLLTRWYVNLKERQAASLFIAYFATQRTGKAPHSPKNCLPGSGWVPSVSDTIQVNVPGRAEPIEVNRYIVSRGSERSLVLYWYQTKHRAVGSEYKAKIYTVVDSIRYNRSDTALVRVVMPLPRDASEESQTKVGMAFIQSFYGNLGAFFPG
jgi:EpsI family protein